MSPNLFFLLAVLIPLFLPLLFVGPLYLGLVAGVYLNYGDPILENAFNVGYILTVFEGLYDYYSANADKVSFLDFTLPIFGPPIIGLLIGTGLLIYFIRYLRNLFIMSSR